MNRFVGVIFQIDLGWLQIHSSIYIPFIVVLKQTETSTWHTYFYQSFSYRNDLSRCFQITYAVCLFPYPTTASRLGQSCQKPGASLEENHWRAFNERCPIVVLLGCSNGVRSRCRCNRSHFWRTRRLWKSFVQKPTLSLLVFSWKQLLPFSGWKCRDVAWHDQRSCTRCHHMFLSSFQLHFDGIGCFAKERCGSAVESDSDVQWWPHWWSHFWLAGVDFSSSYSKSFQCCKGYIFWWWRGIFTTYVSRNCRISSQWWSYVSSLWAKSIWDLQSSCRWNLCEMWEKMEKHMKQTNEKRQFFPVKGWRSSPLDMQKCRHLSKPRGVHRFVRRFVHQGSGSDDSTLCGKKRSAMESQLWFSMDAFWMLLDPGILEWAVDCVVSQIFRKRESELSSFALRFLLSCCPTISDYIQLTLPHFE